MSATAWTITISYSIFILGLTVAYSTWWITRKKEDDIWRWIFTILGALLFSTTFWLSYWMGTLDASWIVWISLAISYIWLFIVFATRSSDVVDHFVFAAFGTMAFGMTAYGGFTSGVRGWWGMYVVFSLAIIWTIYSLLEPD